MHTSIRLVEHAAYAGRPGASTGPDGGLPQQGVHWDASPAAWGPLGAAREKVRAQRSFNRSEGPMRRSVRRVEDGPAVRCARLRVGYGGDGGDERGASGGDGCGSDRKAAR